MAKNIELKCTDILFDLGDTAWVRYGMNSNNLKNWRKVTITAIKFDEERRWYGRSSDSLKNRPEVWLRVRYEVRWNAGTEDDPIWKFCWKDSCCVYESPMVLIEKSLNTKNLSIEKLRAKERELFEEQHRLILKLAEERKNG